MSRVRIGIMASGRGSNAESILRACREGKLDAECVAIVSNKPDAGVHRVAERYGVPSYHVSRDMFDHGRDFAERLISVFRSHRTDLILLAGYMRKVPPALLREWPKAVLNIHPALLPKHGGKGMYGTNVHRDVIRCGESETGVTVHYVDEEYDRGPILHQVGGVPVHPGDTPEELAKQVLEVEHLAYPEAVAKWIDIHR